MVYPSQVLPSSKPIVCCRTCVSPGNYYHHHIYSRADLLTPTGTHFPLEGFLTYTRDHIMVCKFASRNYGSLLRVTRSISQREILFVTVLGRTSFLTTLTDAFSGSFTVEAIDTPKHRPIPRCDYRPPQNRVRVDAPRKPDDFHKLEPTARSGLSCELLFVTTQYIASTFISWSTPQRASITSTLTA